MLNMFKKLLAIGLLILTSSMLGYTTPEDMNESREDRPIPNIHLLNHRELDDLEKNASASKLKALAQETNNAYKEATEVDNTVKDLGNAKKNLIILYRQATDKNVEKNLEVEMRTLNDHLSLLGKEYDEKIKKFRKLNAALEYVQRILENK
jgi:hypothetical protein